MNKKRIIKVLVGILSVVIILRIFIPSILKVRYKAHVVQQMASFREICQSIKHHNKLPENLSIQGIEYDPNAFGDPTQVRLYKKAFRREIVTYGNGRSVMRDNNGRILRDRDITYRDEDREILHGYMKADPNISRQK
jgi:hypothetical protein